MPCTLRTVKRLHSSVAKEYQHLGKWDLIYKYNDLLINSICDPFIKGPYYQLKVIFGTSIRNQIIIPLSCKIEIVTIVTTGMG